MILKSCLNLEINLDLLSQTSGSITQIGAIGSQDIDLIDLHPIFSANNRNCKRETSYIPGLPNYAFWILVVVLLLGLILLIIYFPRKKTLGQAPIELTPMGFRPNERAIAW